MTRIAGSPVLIERLRVLSGGELHRSALQIAITPAGEQANTRVTEARTFIWPKPSMSGPGRTATPSCACSAGSPKTSRVTWSSRS